MTRVESVVIDEESLRVAPLALQDNVFRLVRDRNVVAGAVKHC